nr:hypothetical protein [Moritella viscosa]SHO15746.1 unnamed protein product [Moritella viscosa]
MLEYKYKIIVTFILIIIAVAIGTVTIHYTNFDSEVRECIDKKTIEVAEMEQKYVNSNDLVFRQRFYPEYRDAKYDLGLIVGGSNAEQRKLCGLPEK